MASNKLAQRLLHLLSSAPVRRSAAVNCTDAAKATCAFASQPRPRTMASAAEQMSPVEDRRLEVEKGGSGEGLSRSRRYSPLGAFDVFDSFFPNRNLRSMIDTMDRVFDDPFFGPRSRLPARPTALFNASRPPWDFMETEDAFRMRLDLPGLSKEEVKVYVEEGNLVIKGEHNEASKADESQWASRSQGTHVTRIALPDNVDTEQIKAELKNGVLSVSVPKVLEKQKKLIDVQIE